MFKSEDTKFAVITTESKLVDDLHKKNEFELQELLDRQNNLLKNKIVINKLEDKGEKIIKFRNRLEEELKKHDKILTEKPVFKNSGAYEWRDSNKPKRNVKAVNDDIETKDTTNILQILTENCQIPKTQHARHLIDKEKEPDFSFKPNQSIVAEKIKKIIPEAHTQTHITTGVKMIHLEESLELLTQQISSLTILGNTSKVKTVEECMDDRLNETSLENEQELEDNVDENETSTMVVCVNFES